MNQHVAASGQGNERIGVKETASVRFQTHKDLHNGRLHWPQTMQAGEGHGEQRGTTASGRYRCVGFWSLSSEAKPWLCVALAPVRVALFSRINVQLQLGLFSQLTIAMAKMLNPGRRMLDVTSFWILIWPGLPQGGSLSECLSQLQFAVFSCLFCVSHHPLVSVNNSPSPWG